MLLVPVAGDTIKTKDGIPHKVLAYLPFKAEGPAVLAAGLSDGAPEITVFFNEIAQLAGQKVQLLKNADGYNVFETNGFIERPAQLPQPGDSIKAKLQGDEFEREYEVQRVRVHVKDQLSTGMIFDCIEPPHEEDSPTVQIPLSRITDVDQSLFSREKFLKYYNDYRTTGT
jgi:hypothetical protein